MHVHEPPTLHKAQQLLRHVLVFLGKFGIDTIECPSRFLREQQQLLKGNRAKLLFVGDVLCAEQTPAKRRVANYCSALAAER